MSDNYNNHHFPPPQGGPGTLWQQPGYHAGPRRQFSAPGFGNGMQPGQRPPPAMSAPSTSTRPGSAMGIQQRQSPPAAGQNAWMYGPIPEAVQKGQGASPAPASGGDFHHTFQKAKKNRPLLIGGLLLVLSVLLGSVVFAMWWFTQSTPDVTLYQVGGQNVNQDVSGGGIVFPRLQLDISYPTSELVKAVFVKAGDQVTPKQSLIQLDASQLNIQVQQAASDMAAAQATLNSVAAGGNALQIAQAQQAYQIAKDRYDAMVAQVQSPTLHNGNLISPMSGVISTLNVNPGAVIAANVPLITIMDESTVIVHAKIPLSNLAGVHLGQQATVTPSALPDITMQGVVSSIIPQADPQTDTFEVWVSVTNTNRQLLPGMSTFVHLQSGRRGLVVPRLAVLNPEGKAAVFVVQNLYAHLQPVQVVGRNADAIFIGNGLKSGDKVVLVGMAGLQDNQRVRVSTIERNTASTS